jgi:hypothetical protein
MTTLIEPARSTTVAPERVASPELPRSANLFVRVNDEIRDSYPGNGGLVPFLCECDHDDCFGTVWLSSLDFDAFREREERVACPTHAL